MATRPVSERDRPRYGLDEVRRAVNESRIQITKRALEGALDADLEAQDIPACLESLQPGDFHKSQQHEVPGHEHVWLDIYRPRYRDRDLYVKFHEDTFGHPERLVVRSFKPDESPWAKKAKEE